MDNTPPRLKSSMRTFFTLKNVIVCVVLACLLTLITYVYQQAENDIHTTPTPRSISFSQYPADNLYDGVVAPVDFESNKDAATFRTAITNAVNTGVNFAGHYIIATWGCGTSCEGLAIVDALDGAIVVYNLLSEEGVAYRKDSNLLIVNPIDNYSAVRRVGRQIATDYYVLDEGALYLIAKEVEGDIVSMCTPREIIGEQSVTGERQTFSSPCKMPFGWFEVTE